jgi:hypothetical protein
MIPSVDRLGNSRRCGAEGGTFLADHELGIEITIDPEIRAAAKRARPQLPRREHRRCDWHRISKSGALFAAPGFEFAKGHATGLIAHAG